MVSEIIKADEEAESLPPLPPACLTSIPTECDILQSSLQPSAGIR